MMMEGNIAGNQQALGNPFSGTLESKSNSVMMPWKNRKTILTKDGIEIMHDGDKESVKHHLRFDDRTIIAVADTSKGKGGFLRTAFAPNQDAFKFCVITGSGMEEFNAHSAEERNEWIRHICELADKKCMGGGFVVSVGADTDFQYIRQWVDRWTTTSMDQSAGILAVDSTDVKENADPSKNKGAIENFHGFSAQGDINFQGFVPFDQWLHKLEPEAYNNRVQIRENRKTPGKPTGERIRDYMANKMVQNFSESATPKLCNMLLEGMCVLLARSERSLVRRYHMTSAAAQGKGVLPQEKVFKAGPHQGASSLNELEGSRVLVKGQPGTAPDLDLQIDIPLSVQMDLLCMLSSLRALICTYRFEDATTADSQMRFLRKLSIHRLLLASGAVLQKLQEEAKDAIEKGVHQVQKVVEQNLDSNIQNNLRNPEELKNKGAENLKQTAEKIEKPAEKLLEKQRAGALKEVAAGLVGKDEESQDFDKEKEGKDFNKGQDFNKDFDKDQNKGQGFQQGSSSIGMGGIHSQQHGIGGSQLQSQGLSGQQQHQGSSFGMIGAGLPISQQHGGLHDQSKDNDKKDWEKEIDSIRQGKSSQGSSSIQGHDNKNLGVGVGLGLGKEQHGQQGVGGIQQGSGSQPVHSIGQHGQQGIGGIQSSLGSKDNKNVLDKDNKSHDNKQFGMGGFHEGKQSEDHDRFENRSSSLDNKFQSLGMGAGRMNQGGHSEGKEGDILNKNLNPGLDLNQGGLSEEERRNLRRTGAEMREQVLERFRSILHPLLTRVKDEVSPLVQNFKERADMNEEGEDVDNVVNDVTHSLSKAVIQYVERNIDKLESTIERQLEVILELVADMKEAGQEGKELDTNALMDKMLCKAGEATGEDPDKAQQMVQKTAQTLKQMRDNVQNKMREAKEHGGMPIFGTQREALESAVLERCDDLMCVMRDVVGKSTSGAMMGLLFLFGTGMSSERAPVVSTDKGVFPPVLPKSAPTTEQV